MDETFEDMLQRIIYLEFGSDGLKYYLDKTSAKDEIIKIIDEMIEDKQKYYEKSNYSDRMVCMLCIEDDFCYHEYKILALTELKEKLK